MENKNQELIHGLIKFAEFLMSHPDLPFICGTRYDIWTQRKDEFDEVRKTMGGHLEKGAIANSFYLRKHFGPEVTLDVNVQRSEVCEQVKVGEKIVPAEPEKTVTIPATEERIEDVYEWRCGPVLDRDLSDMIKEEEETVGEIE